MITSRAEGASSSGGYTVYYVEVRTKLSSWAVAYRFSQLEKFHNKLRKKGLTLPPFPEKRFFKNNEKVVADRKKSLQNYLNQMAASMDIFTDDVICEFLHFKSSTRDFLKDMLLSEHFEQERESFMQAKSPYERKQSLLMSTTDNRFDLEFSQDDVRQSMRETVLELDFVKMQKEMSLKPEEVLHCYFTKM